MLSQIELGHSTPTINILWKIVHALRVPFSALLSSGAASRTVRFPKDHATVLTSPDGTFSSRALFPFHKPRNVEFYELRLAAKSSENAEAHPPGTTENIIVGEGAVEIRFGTEKHLLAEGDALFFDADVAHTYTNHGFTEAVMYLVMEYIESVR